MTSKHQHGTARVSGTIYKTWLLEHGWKPGPNDSAERVHCFSTDTPQKSEAGKRKGTHFPVPCEKGGGDIVTGMRESWRTYNELIAEGVAPEDIAYCMEGDDAPAVVVVNIIADQRGEGQTEKQFALACRLRDWLETHLRLLGAPVYEAGEPENRMAVFQIKDPAWYRATVQLWEHKSMLTVGLLPPGALTWTKMYALDGDIPVIDPAEFDHWLIKVKLEKRSPVAARGEMAGS